MAMHVEKQRQMSVHLLAQIEKKQAHTISDKTAYKNCAHHEKTRKGNKNAERQNGNWTKMRRKTSFCNEQTVGPEMDISFCRITAEKTDEQKQKKIVTVSNDSRHEFRPLLHCLIILSFLVSVSSTRYIAITIVVIS